MRAPTAGLAVREEPSGQASDKPYQKLTLLTRW
jgi:hypothetical protein